MILTSRCMSSWPVSVYQTNSYLLIQCRQTQTPLRHHHLLSALFSPNKNKIIIIIKLYLQKHHVNYQLIICARVRVFYATFNNISVISWRSVLLARNLEYPEKTINLPQITDKPFSRNVVSSTPRLSGVRTHNTSHDMH